GGHSVSEPRRATVSAAVKGRRAVWSPTRTKVRGSCWNCTIVLIALRSGLLLRRARPPKRALEQLPLRARPPRVPPWRGRVPLALHRPRLLLAAPAPGAPPQLRPARVPDRCARSQHAARARGARRAR